MYQLYILVVNNSFMNSLHVLVLCTRPSYIYQLYGLVVCTSCIYQMYLLVLYTGNYLYVQVVFASRKY